MPSALSVFHTKLRSLPRFFRRLSVTNPFLSPADYDAAELAAMETIPAASIARSNLAPTRRNDPDRQGRTGNSARRAAGNIQLSGSLIPPGMACSSVSRTSLGQMRAAIATKASGLYLRYLANASKPSSAQTSAKSRIKP